MGAVTTILRSHARIHTILPTVPPYICVLLLVETVLSVRCSVSSVFLTRRSNKRADADQPTVDVVSFSFFFFFSFREPRGPFSSRTSKPKIAWAASFP